MAPWTPSKLLMQSNSVEYQTYISLIIMILAKRVYNLVSREARVLRVVQAWPAAKSDAPYFILTM